MDCPSLPDPVSRPAKLWTTLSLTLSPPHLPPLPLPFPLLLLLPTPLFISLSPHQHSEIALISILSLQFSSNFGRSDMHSYFNLYTINKHLNTCSALCWFWDTKLKKVDTLGAYRQVGDINMQAGKCSLLWEHITGAHGLGFLRNQHLSRETEG